MSTITQVARERAPQGRDRFGGMQRFAKSLMLPIALLPVAGLFLRIGQPDLLGRFDIPVVSTFFAAMTAAGDEIFKNLALLFAVGLAVGMAKKADASIGLSAVAGFLVMQSVFTTMSPIVLAGRLDKAGEQEMISYGVFAGIVVGLITARLFDRYHDIELPTYLGFFGGRRFVPIVVSLACLVAAFALSYVYWIFAAVMGGVGHFIAGSGALGAFVYGVVNRMLIPLGLHHLVNTYVWFVYGDYSAAGKLVHGELARFNVGDPSAGLLTSGFYPVLMFGLPGAALAMMHVARPEQKKVAAGIFGAAGLTAFLTGITEPLEFAFMFAAFPLYVIHALLTGLSMAICYVLDIHLGFSFSAGLFDLLLYGSGPAAKNIPLLIGVGVVFFALYYVLFRFAITKWNLRTPGRTDDLEAGTDAEAVPTGRTEMAEKLVDAFGGAGNLSYVDACITRLRIEVADKAKVDKARLQALGAAGVIEVGNNVQAVFGPRSEILKDDIRRVLDGRAVDSATDPAAAAAAAGAAATTPGGEVVIAPLAGRAVPLSEVPDAAFAQEKVGRGVAIEPADAPTTVVAPVDGRIVQLWPHAFAIQTESGAGVLVHLGIDTVQLKGEGFTTLAAKGDTVRAGDAVVEYDVPAVRAAGKAVVVPVVVLQAKEGSIVDAAHDAVAARDALFRLER